MGILSSVVKNMLILFALSVALVMLHLALSLYGVKGLDHDNKTENGTQKSEDEQGRA